MIELLAPAGDFECLRAAVLNGANAVYIGGKEFSARQYAGNFDREEMVEAVRYCHCYGVKVYVTMNTLYANNELEGAIAYAAFLYETGVDALIIQDVGFLKLLRMHLPDFELHASTQMTVHNLDGVNLLYSMGIKRVVLSREVSLKEIEYIAKNSEAELEVFVHGALCISFSGQCLFSSMIGGRSGNRGRCAQPCRQRYTFDEDKGGHLLSPKDLSTLELIHKIKETGVVSLKIEGRMKKPEYVSGIVSAYKHALASEADASDKEKVHQLFNRGGFTTYNLVKKQGSSMMSYERPGNWGAFVGTVVSAKPKFATIRLENNLTVGDGVENFDAGNGVQVSKIWVSGKEVQKAHAGELVEIYLEKAKPKNRIYKSYDVEIVTKEEQSYKGLDIPRVPLTGVFRAETGSCISFVATHNSGIEVKVEGTIPEPAMKTATSSERICEALSKTKDTAFYFEKLDIQLEDGLAIPVSGLNKLRRDALDAITDKLQRKRSMEDFENSMAHTKKTGKPKNSRNTGATVIPKLVVITGNLEAARAAAQQGCEIVFFGGDELRTNTANFSMAQELESQSVQIRPWYPEILLEEYENRKRAAQKYVSAGMDKVLCGNPGLYSTLDKTKCTSFLTSGFNIFNSAACDVFENSIPTLSTELNMKQLKEVINNTASQVMVMVHGRQKLMTSRHCFTGSIMGHGKAGCPNLCDNKAHYLKDKMGESFMVVTDNYCRSHLYNSKILCTIEHFKDIINLESNYLAIFLLDESYDEAALVVEAYKNQLERSLAGDWRLCHEAETLLDNLKGNITKGHFYRGVL